MIFPRCLVLFYLFSRCPHLFFYSILLCMVGIQLRFYLSTKSMELSVDEVIAWSVKCLPAEVIKNVLGQYKWIFALIFRQTWLDQRYGEKKGCGESKLGIPCRLSNLASVFGGIISNVWNISSNIFEIFIEMIPGFRLSCNVSSHCGRFYKTYSANKNHLYRCHSNKLRSMSDPDNSNHRSPSILNESINADLFYRQISKRQSKSNWI